MQDPFTNRSHTVSHRLLKNPSWKIARRGLLSAITLSRPRDDQAAARGRGDHRGSSWPMAETLGSSGAPDKKKAPRPKPRGEEESQLSNC